MRHEIHSHASLVLFYPLAMLVKEVAFSVYCAPAGGHCNGVFKIVPV